MCKCKILPFLLIFVYYLIKTNMKNEKNNRKLFLKGKDENMKIKYTKVLKI